MIERGELRRPLPRPEVLVSPLEDLASIYRIYRKHVTMKTVCRVLELSFEALSSRQVFEAVGSGSTVE